jgi:glycosyltransferase involved in cell wall biosynthesis
VSIVTPTYNHEAFVERCIRSVLAQTFQDWELLIVDDGSTDRTGELVRSFADPRVRYRRQERAGLAGLARTYNTALDDARGELVAILEGDDYWPPHKLALQVADFDDPSVVVSFGRTQEVSETGAPLKLIPSGNLPAEALHNRPTGRAARYLMDVDVLTFLFPVSVMVRRSALTEIGGFRALPGLPLVDFPTFLALSRCGGFAFHDEVLGYWQRHAQSATRNRFYAILDGVHVEVERFLDGHRRDLPIRADEVAAIRAGWADLRFRQWFTLGRWFLADGDFARARGAFHRSRPFASTPARLGLVALGVTASLGRRTLEPLAKALRLDPLKPLLAAFNGDNVMVSKEMLTATRASHGSRGA